MPTHTKGPRKHLEVVIDGRKLAGRATDVFVAALVEIGLERIAGQHITLSGQPLVSDVPPSRSFRQRGKWYVATHSDTAEKHSVLVRLKERLGLANIDVRLTEAAEELLA